MFVEGMFDTPSRSDHALMQDPAFARALRLCGQTPVHLPSGLLLLHRWVCGIPIAMLPRGTPPPDFAAQLEMRGLSRTPVILSPETPNACIPGIKLRRGRQRAVLDLTFDTSKARAKLHQKWRNQLKRAEANAMTVSIAPFAPQKDMPFLRQAQQQAKERHYAGWPPALTTAFARVAPDQTHLLTAHLEGDILAQVLFLTHGRNASYHIGHTTSEGRARYAHNLLLWRGSWHLAQLGYEALDLGLMHDQTPGLNRFKLRMGARREHTGGTWLYWCPFARKAQASSAA